MRWFGKPKAKADQPTPAPDVTVTQSPPVKDAQLGYPVNPKRVYPSRGGGPSSQRHFERCRKLRQAILQEVGETGRWCDYSLSRLVSLVATKLGVELPPVTDNFPSWVAVDRLWAAKPVQLTSYLVELADRERMSYGMSHNELKHMGALKAHHRARKALRDVLKGRHGPVVLGQQGLPILSDDPGLNKEARQLRANQRKQIDDAIKRRDLLLRGEG